MSSPDSRGSLTVGLYCGHSVTFSPAPALHDLVYCRRCTKYRHVTRGATPRQAFVLKIKCRECRMARNFEDMRDAEIRATTHNLRTGHAVDILTNSGVTRKTVC